MILMSMLKNIEPLFNCLRRFRTVVLGLCCLGLVGCSAFMDKAKNDWGDDLPDRQIFVNEWQKDAQQQALASQEDYLTWVKRFYRGWVIVPRGWFWMSEEVLSQSPPDVAAEVSPKLAMLGIKISAEWAKEDQVRVINTRHIMVWRDALKIAVRERSLIPLSDYVVADVESLLARRISPKDIDLVRYFPSEFDDMDDTEFEDEFAEVEPF